MSGYSEMAVEQLGEELAERGLKKSGKKDELIARLEDYDAKLAEAKGAEEEGPAEGEEPKPARRRSAETSTARETKPAPRSADGGVTIAAPLNLPSSMAEHASQLYGRNVLSLLELMTGENGALELDFDDEVIAGACITRGGEIVHEGAKQAAGAAA